MTFEDVEKLQEDYEKTKERYKKRALKKLIRANNRDIKKAVRKGSKVCNIQVFTGIVRIYRLFKKPIYINYHFYQEIKDYYIMNGFYLYRDSYTLSYYINWEKK